MPSCDPPQHTQVLVVGGGPAGSFAAAALAREGFKVVLFEASKFPRYHIGESLIPSVRHYLRFIEAEDKVSEYGFAHTDFVALGHDNNAWNVVRSEFDQVLLQHAASSGVRVFENTRVTSLSFASPSPHSANAKSGPEDLGRPISASYYTSDDQNDGEPDKDRKGGKSITFDYFIDATGRAGLMCTKYLKNRSVSESLKNVALWGYWKNTGVYAPGTGRENAPWFEALVDESGWAWFIPLHNGLTSVGVVMDQKTFAARGKSGKGRERAASEAVNISFKRVVPPRSMSMNEMTMGRASGVTTESGGRRASEGAAVSGHPSEDVVVIKGVKGDEVGAAVVKDGRSRRGSMSGIIGEASRLFGRVRRSTFSSQIQLPVSDRGVGAVPQIPEESLPPSCTPSFARSEPSTPLSTTSFSAFSYDSSGETVSGPTSSNLEMRYRSLLHLAPGVLKLIGGRGELMVESVGMKEDEGEGPRDAYSHPDDVSSRNGNACGDSSQRKDGREKWEDGGGQDGRADMFGVRSASDFSYSAACYAGEGWRVIGDAGAFIDPFFSSGVHLALTGALSAALTIAASIRGDCSEEDAAEWHTSRVGMSYTRFLVVVLSAYKQIRAQNVHVLADVDEDNFDRAFAFLRPVIQGAGDIGPHLYPTELDKALDFCVNLFNPTTPELHQSVGEILESETKSKSARLDEKAEDVWKRALDVSSPPMDPEELGRIVKDLEFISPSPNPPMSFHSESMSSSCRKAEHPLTFPDDVKLVLDKVNARRVIHAEHSGLGAFENEALVGGLVGRLVRGKLGLRKLDNVGSP
ncbi:hypothetical protein JAAARDRAFT_196058 [Jaapia argillacea MUCL 33604]|uniref:FAD-binding domain-containing protein n=1 Tax=Jaapia argillacea MUCL 33604 TaxID=933084 RepID=A0A067PXY0_9AGAM|nr:hypothetical protein JAAARDRAFT_196058 [Jaapia argillacea MUCL 33604]